MTQKFFPTLALISVSFILLLILNKCNQSSISSIIIPHHDMVKNERASFINKFEFLKPQTIILVSPDHFYAGTQNITTTKHDWQLGQDVFYSDKAKIDQLLEENTKVKIQENAFTKEHGIFNVIGEIKKTFPESKIIPIILKENSTFKELNELNETLDRVCKNQCLLISSIDFSHYQPSSIAFIHDLYSLKALKNLDDKMAFRAEVDSPAALTLSILWAKKHKTSFFDLYLNTNSGQITNEPDAESTSYVLGSFKKGLKAISIAETFAVGSNLKQIKDQRLINGVDEKIELNDKDNLENLCKNKLLYCQLKEKLEKEPLNITSAKNLLIVGSIQNKKIRIAVAPLDKNGVILRGGAKLKVINDLRRSLNLPHEKIQLNYDIINLK